MDKILIPKKGNSTFTMIYAKTGSRDETNKIKGVSHFLEHMMFKGTKTKNAKQIAYGIEKYGAVFNAFTDDEITAYWVKSSNKYKVEAANILIDMLTNSTFPQEELDKERNVIIQELNMYKDHPIAYVQDIYSKALFEEQCGLHLPILGTMDSLKNIDRDIIKNYFANSYKNNLTFMQVGDVEQEKATIGGPSQFPRPLATKSIKGRNDVIETRKNINQANVIIGNIIRPNNKTRLKTLILTDLFEGVLNDMSGRLFSTLREKHNLCYRVHFGMGIFRCGSLGWWTSIGLNAENIDFAYKLIMEELTKEITKEEIDYALTKKIGEKALRYDDVRTIGRVAAYCDLKGVDYKEYIFNYEKHLREQSKHLKDFVKSINFTDNVVAQLVPDKK